MTGRERVRRALRHQPTDRPPIDLGSTPVTGIAASTYAKLRRELGLASADQPVKVGEPFQILAEVEEDVRQALGVDTIGLWGRGTLFGFKQDGWKPWTLPDGTPAMVSKQFEYSIEPGTGDTLIYPCGDRTAEPSGRLPKGGYYFDSIIRQGELDEDHLDPQDWAEQFGVFDDDELSYLQRTCDRMYRETDYAVIGCFWQGGLGDVAAVPGEMLRKPKGLRDPNLWYEFLLTHPDYIRGIFKIQTDVALKNLELYRQAVGDKVEVLVMSGTDFGMQTGPIASLEVFRTLWKPFYQQLNNWVHRNTPWKIFYHTCGGILPLIPELIDVGVDILNPVQCSAKGMDPAGLKAKFGDKLTFWGGGVDTQHILPFGTPEEVRRNVRERLETFSPGGGFVFNTIHNIQHGVPPANVVAMFDEVRSFGSVPA